MNSNGIAPLTKAEIRANVEDEIRHARMMEDGVQGVESKRAWTARRMGFETVLRWLTGECACTPEDECQKCGYEIARHEGRAD